MASKESSSNDGSRFAQPLCAYPQSSTAAIKPSSLRGSCSSLVLVRSSSGRCSTGNPSFLVGCVYDLLLGHRLPPTWDNCKLSRPYFSREASVLGANDLHEKALEDVVVKWSEFFTNEKLARSVVVISSWSVRRQDSRRRNGTRNSTLDYVKLRRSRINRSQLHTPVVLLGSKHCRAMPASRISLPVNSARELRTQPINTSALFDNVILIVRLSAVSSGHFFPKPLTKSVSASSASSSTKRRNDPPLFNKNFKKLRYSSPYREQRSGGGRGGGRKGGRGNGRKGGGGGKEKLPPLRVRSAPNKCAIQTDSSGNDH